MGSLDWLVVRFFKNNWEAWLYTLNQVFDYWKDETHTHTHPDGYQDGS
jgi:hypothetical protein